MVSEENGMPTQPNWQRELEEYIRQGEPGRAERSASWKVGIGLQAVDGLTTSDYLLEIAKQQIEGAIDIEAAQRRIVEYYETRVVRQENESADREADLVSSKIAELLQEQTFKFSPAELWQTHKRLFSGTFDHAGEYRRYNISKKEWVLRGKSVVYASWDSIKDTLDYDFSQEASFSYQGLTQRQAVAHLAKFIAGVWQIHPFCEGNTRATAVFLIKYLRSMGFDVGNRPFEENSWYFRNALVRANYTDLTSGVYETTEYLELFLENLLYGAKNKLKNRYMHLDYESVVEGIQQDHKLGSAENPTSTRQVPDKLTRQVTRLVEVLGDGESSASELMGRLGLRDRETFYANYLNPALEAGLIERTIPDKPRSNKQKYRKVRK